MSPALFDLAGRSVFVAGHRGMVGSALMRRLQREPVRLLTAARSELDLTRQADVERWMARYRPEVVIVAAAKVGGILANDRDPVDFLVDNLLIETNLIRAAHEQGVAKLLFLGSSCIYPKHAPQPIPESALLTGPLEPTNEWYAIAKIAGLKMSQAYRKQYGFNAICAMPTNLYGPGDNFDLNDSHVLPALIRKFTEAVESGADEVEVWGTGIPRREFLHVDDLAEAILFALSDIEAADVYDRGISHLNVGSGTEISILDVAIMISGIVGFDGEIVLDWAALPAGLDPEARLSRLTAWVCEASRLGLRFRLRLPGQAIPGDVGPNHARRCLEVLALFGEETAHGPA